MDKLPVKYFDLKDAKAGIFAMGLVEEPAIMREWIKLSKKKPSETFKLQTVNEEKQIVSGIALVPEMDIYREDKNGEAYNLRFDVATIFELGQGIIRNNVHSNTTINHVSKTGGVHLCEIWYIDDVTCPKALKLDPNPTIGSLALSYKVENKDVWENYIKTGKLTGFSIEAKEGELSKQLSKQLNTNKMSKPTKWERAKTLLAEFANDGVTLAEFLTEDGALVLVADSLEEKQPIFVKGEEDAEDVPAPDGEYIMEGMITVITKDGLIDSVEQGEPAESDEELAAKAKAEELAATELAAAKKGADKLDSILTLLEKQKEIVHLSKEDVLEIIKAELKALPIELSKPGAPIKKETLKPTRAQLAAMSTRERTSYNALN